MKNLLLVVLLVLPLLLDGCYTPLVEGAQEGYDAVQRDPLHADAASGDPVAQYKLGDTYCCKGGGPMDKVSIYDNQKATYWYCHAARQGYGPAQMRLAQVYSGHPIHGLHIALRASAMVGNAETDFGIALMWASVAANHGVENAIALRDEIKDQATDKERAKAAALVKNWQSAPCQWAAVFPAAASAR
jgi:TPR repeat protein